MTGYSCVVTGAARGLGGAIAALLVDRGWTVVGVDLAPSQRVAADGSTAVHEVIGDVSDPAVHERAGDLAASLAPLGGWVNCAGYNVFGSVADLSEADLQRGIGVNMLAAFHGSGSAARRFLAQPRAERRGSIVNISSIQASVGFPGFAAYAMAKGGVEALTRQVAAEYIGAGIRSNAVAPGLVEGPMNQDLLDQAADPEQVKRRWEQITPMGRQATPGDVASAVAFLLSSEASYLTGEVLRVNGGALIVAPGATLP